MSLAFRPTRGLELAVFLLLMQTLALFFVASRAGSVQGEPNHMFGVQHRIQPVVSISGTWSCQGRASCMCHNILHPCLLEKSRVVFIKQRVRCFSTICSRIKNAYSVIYLP